MSPGPQTHGVAMDKSLLKRVPAEYVSPVTPHKRIVQHVSRIRQKIYGMVFEDGVAYGGVIELEIDCHPRKDNNPFKAYGYYYIPKPTNPTRIHPYAVADYRRKSDFPKSPLALTLQSARLAPVGPKYLLALTVCCHQMRTEGLDTLFANSTLSFDISSSIPLNISQNHLIPRIKGSLAIVDNFLKTMPLVEKTKKLVFLVINTNFGKLFGPLHTHLTVVCSFLPRLTQPPHILLEMPVAKWAGYWICKKHRIDPAVGKAGAFSGQMTFDSMDEGKETRSRKLYRLTHEVKQVHKKPAKKRYVYKHQSPAQLFDENDGKLWLRNRPRFDISLEGRDAALDDVVAMHTMFWGIWHGLMRERPEHTVGKGGEDGEEGEKECCDYRAFEWYSFLRVGELMKDTLKFFPAE